MNPALSMFDNDCPHCRRYEPHIHVAQRFEQRRGQNGLWFELVTDFASVYPPEEIAEWRWYRRGHGRRPRPLRDLVAC